jgi:hypothetical protein
MNLPDPILAYLIFGGFFKCPEEDCGYEWFLTDSHQTGKLASGRGETIAHPVTVKDMLGILFAHQLTEHGVPGV